MLLSTSPSASWGMQMSETENRPDTTKLFQIKENDLADLERVLPRLFEKHMRAFDNNQDRVAIRVIQRIITDIRWNYGPASDVKDME